MAAPSKPLFPPRVNLVVGGKGGAVTQETAVSADIRGWRLEVKSERPGGSVGREPRAPGRPLRLARGKLRLEGKGNGNLICKRTLGEFAESCAQTVNLYSLLNCIKAKQQR